MGLDRDSVGFLVTAKRLGARFSETLTLGRQRMLLDEPRLRAGFVDGGARLAPGQAAAILEDPPYAERLLAHLGADRVESIDVSDFEGCTLQHDLNDPLPTELHARFSVVLDGGTLEHVFDYPAALRNALEAVRVGGHFVSIAPTSGYCGHGFYQFSPELFYRVLAPTNGFRVTCALLRPQRWGASWRTVPDPQITGSRILFGSAWPTQIFVLAERVEICPVLAVPPQQSDYAAAWRVGDQRAAPPPPPLTHRPRTLRSMLPRPIKEIGRSWMSWRDARGNLPRVRLTDVGLERRR